MLGRPPRHICLRTHFSAQTAPGKIPLPVFRPTSSEKRNLEILHVIGGVSAESGGPTAALQALVELAKYWPAKVVVAVAMTDFRDEPVIARLRELGGKVWHYPREPFHPWGYSRAFSRAIFQLVENADVVHVHGMWNWAPYWALRCARRAHKRAIIRPAGALDSFDLQKHRLAKRVLGPVFLRPFFQAPNVFHCTARRESNNLVTYGGNAERKVLALPVSVDVEASKANREEARSRLKISPTAKVVLFLGRINYKKGLDVLVPAIAHARKKIPELVLLLAGDGELEIKMLISRLSSELGLADAIRAVGFVRGQQKSDVLAASDLFALPSMNENFGVSVVEALGAGLPVLITRGVYIADDIADSHAVKICERTPEAVAKGLMSMIGSADQNRMRSTAARAVWRERYSSEVLRDVYWNFYCQTARFDSFP